jgi:hypothetical protein
VPPWTSRWATARTGNQRPTDPQRGTTVHCPPRRGPTGHRAPPEGRLLLPVPLFPCDAAPPFRRTATRSPYSTARAPGVEGSLSPPPSSFRHADAVRRCRGARLADAPGRLSVPLLKGCFSLPPSSFRRDGAVRRCRGPRLVGAPHPGRCSGAPSQGPLFPAALVSPPRRRCAPMALSGGAERTGRPLCPPVLAQEPASAGPVPSPPPPQYRPAAPSTPLPGPSPSAPRPLPGVTRLDPAGGPGGEAGREDARMGIRTLRRRTATAAGRLPQALTRLSRVQSHFPWAPHRRWAHTLIPWRLTHPVPALLGHVPPYAPGAARPRIPRGAPVRRRPVLSGGPSCPPPRRLRSPQRKPGARS